MSVHVIGSYDFTYASRGAFVGVYDFTYKQHTSVSFDFTYAQGISTLHYDFTYAQTSLVLLSFDFVYTTITSTAFNALMFPARDGSPWLT